MSKCSICRESFSEHSCNAYPLTGGDCCSRCDDLIVTPLRMLQARCTVVVNLIAVECFQQAIEMRAAKKKLIKKIINEKKRQKKS